MRLFYNFSKFAQNRRDVREDKLPQKLSAIPPVFRTRFRGESPGLRRSGFPRSSAQVPASTPRSARSGRQSSRGRGGGKPVERERFLRGSVPRRQRDYHIGVTVVCLAVLGCLARGLLALLLHSALPLPRREPPRPPRRDPATYQGSFLSQHAYIFYATKHARALLTFTQISWKRPFCRFDPCPSPPARNVAHGEKKASVCQS